MKKPLLVFVGLCLAFFCVYHLIQGREDKDDQSEKPGDTSAVTLSADSKEGTSQESKNTIAKSNKGDLTTSIQAGNLAMATPLASATAQSSENASKTDKRFERPDSSQIIHLTSVAWIESNKYDPHSSSFDAKLLQDAGAVPSWKPYKSFRTGIYDGLFVPLSNADNSVPFSIYLFTEASSGLIRPGQLQWYKDGQDIPLQDVSSFVSPFASQEHYNKALHFPTTVFSSAIEDLQSCVEILLIPYMETSKDIRVIETVSLRCYCRKGLDQLSAIGQMAIEFDQ